MDAQLTIDPSLPPVDNGRSPSGAIRTVTQEERPVFALTFEPALVGAVAENHAFDTESERDLVLNGVEAWGRWQRQVASQTGQLHGRAPETDPPSLQEFVTQRRANNNYKGPETDAVARWITRGQGGEPSPYEQSARGYIGHLATVAQASRVGNA